MRPKLQGKIFSKIARETSINIKNYLMDPIDDKVDDYGNTTMHQLTKFERMDDYKALIDNNPHLLFMLNKQGMTPLDVAINEQDEDKAKALMDTMQRYNPNCSLKFVKRSHRLDLKYEKAFTIAVLRNNAHLIQAFPPKSLRTSYISMSQVMDYKKYKEEKSQVVN